MVMGEVLNDHRGNRLHYQGDPVYIAPVLTGPIGVKWYDCSIVHPDGRIETADMGEQRDEIWTYSHCPHPARLFSWAEKHRIRVDPNYMADVVDTYNNLGSAYEGDDIAEIGPYANVPHVYVRTASRPFRVEPEDVIIGSVVLHFGDEVAVQMREKTRTLTVNQERITLGSLFEGAGIKVGD